jgi:hypothetical protein
MPLLFGSDPELFASRTDSNGKKFVVPPIFFQQNFGLEPIIPDVKHPVFAKLPVNDHEEVKIISDGVAFELTVPPRTNTLELLDLIHMGYDKVGEIVSKYGYDISVVPAINFDTTEYREMNDDFIMCLLFGCDPDKDAFNTEAKEFEESALDHPYRYGGGHIHISGSEFIKEFPIPCVRLLALTVGNFVNANSPVPELEKLRTYRYGMPGKYRIQKYGKDYNEIPNTSVGIEYRTPSNTWTKYKKMAEGIQYWAEIAIEKILPNRNMAKEIFSELQDSAVKAILDTDQNLAKKNLNMVSTILGL